MSCRPSVSAVQGICKKNILSPKFWSSKKAATIITIAKMTFVILKMLHTQSIVQQFRTSAGCRLPQVSFTPWEAEIYDFNPWARPSPGTTCGHFDTTCVPFLVNSLSGIPKDCLWSVSQPCGQQMAIFGSAKSLYGHSDPLVIQQGHSYLGQRACAKKKVPFSQINISLLADFGCIFGKKRIFGPFSAFRQNVKTPVSP